MVTTYRKIPFYYIAVQITCSVIYLDGLLGPSNKMLKHRRGGSVQPIPIVKFVIDHIALLKLKIRIGQWSFKIYYPYSINVGT